MEDLKAHQETHDGVDRPYSCPLCRKEFESKWVWKKHVKNHTAEKRFKCAHCDMRFRDPSHLDEHERVHTGVKPYKCSYCDKTFSKTSNWKLHETIHTGLLEYPCRHCGARLYLKMKRLLLYKAIIANHKRTTKFSWWQQPDRYITLPKRNRTWQMFELRVVIIKSAITLN